MPDEQTDQLAREWLQIADEDLVICARALQVPTVPRSASFHAQQAAEKALKAFLIWHGRVPGRTHDLAALLRVCVELDRDLDQLVPLARMLSPFVLTGRYPDVDESPPPDEEQAQEALRSARAIVDFVVDRLPPDIRP